MKCPIYPFGNESSVVNRIETIYSESLFSFYLFFNERVSELKVVISDLFFIVNLVSQANLSVK